MDAHIFTLPGAWGGAHSTLFELDGEALPLHRPLPMMPWPPSSWPRSPLQVPRNRCRSPDQPPDKKETFGAVVGPSTLPAGATAAYAYVGLPEVGVGFRQGLWFGEWEARARANFLDRPRRVADARWPSSRVIGEAPSTSRPTSAGASRSAPARATSIARRSVRGRARRARGRRGVPGPDHSARGAEAPIDFALGTGGRPRSERSRVAARRFTSPRRHRPWCWRRRDWIR